MGGNLRKSAVLAAGLLLAGCSQSVTISEWASGYDKAMETASNENMLINMVRAAYNQPMHFATVAVVRGNGQVSPNVGASAFLPFLHFLDVGSTPAGFQGASLSPSASLSVSGGFNFDMASLDNSEFISGLLTPISPTTVHYYVSQGIPKELLFNLLVDRVEISDSGHTSTYVNDPNDEHYDDFLITLRNLLSLGLTTENVQDIVPFGPLLTSTDAKNPQLLAAIAPAGILLMPVGTGPNAQYQLVRPVQSARFCFTGGGPDMPRLPDSALCQNVKKQAPAAVTGGQGQQNFNAGSAIPGFENAALAVTIRSTRDVFNYLGNLIYQQAEDATPVHLMLQSKEAKAYNYLNRGEEMIVVRKNQARSDDLVHVEYRGATYSIPVDHQGNSALVFTVVSQILNLSKSVNLIPTTSAVVVR
jgi:hypothetical protein